MKAGTAEGVINSSTIDEIRLFYLLCMVGVPMPQCNYRKRVE